MKKAAFLLYVFLLSINSIGQNNLDELKFLILSSKYSEALDTCNSFISNNPNNPELYYYQALINKLSFRYSEADISIKNALVLDSANINYLAEYGFILLKRDKEREAQKVFEKIIEKNSYHISSGISLSNIYLKQKQYEKAKNILLNLYSNDTTNGYFARNMGLCSIKLKDSKNAIKWLKRAIELDSTDIKAYEYISLVYTSKKEFDLALENLEKANRFDPQNIDLYINIGDINVMRNHNYKAIPAYFKAYELDKGDYVISKNIGICYFKVKKFNEAKHYLDIANSLTVDLQVYKHLGNIHMELNQSDSSIFYYNKTLKLLKPDNNLIFEILVDKAESYYALNNFEEAIEVYEKALELDLSGDFWISYKKNKIIIDIAAIYQDKLGDKLKAIEYYEKVIEPEIAINKNYYTYAQQQITKLKEELFFEGKL